MTVSLFEHKTDYLSWDSNDDLHVLVPLTAGMYDEALGIGIGTDNTCQSRQEFNEFVKNINLRLEEYISSLQNDIDILTYTSGFSDLLNKKKNRLLQAQKYKKLFGVLTLCYNDTLFKQFTNYVLTNNPLNGGSISLSPRNDSSYLLYNPSLFSLKRGTDSFFVKSKSKVLELQKFLHLFFKENAKEKLFEKVKSSVPDLTDIKNDDDLARVKNAFVQVIKEFYSEYLSFEPETDSTKQKTKTTFEYFTNLCVVNPGDPIDEWLEYIFNAGTNDIGRNQFTENYVSSPFIPLADPNPDKKAANLEKISYCLQFLLGIINVFYYENTGIMRNFGDIFYEKIDLFFPKAIKDIKKGISPEDSLIDFINERHGNDIAQHFFSRKLSPDEIALIKKRFNMLWSMISGSLHFDEFIFYLPKKEGSFFYDSSRISAHVSVLTKLDYFKNSIKLLPRDFYGLIEKPTGELVKHDTNLPLDRLSPKSIARFIILDRKKIDVSKRQVTNEFSEKLKELDDYKQILQALAADKEATQGLINDFFPSFPRYSININALSGLYEQCPFREQGKSGEERLKAALKRNKIPFKKLSIDDKGLISLEFKDLKEFKKGVSCLLEIENRSYSIITEEQLSSILGVNRITDQLLGPAVIEKLKNNQGEGGSSVTVAKVGKAYKIEGNVKTLQKVNKLSDASLSFVLEKDDLEKLYQLASINHFSANARVDIEKALKKQHILYKMVLVHQGCWEIVASNQAAKEKLQRIFNPETFAKTKQSNERSRKIKEGLERTGLSLLVAVVFGVAASAIATEIGVRCKQFYDRRKQKRDSENLNHIIPTHVTSAVNNEDPKIHPFNILLSPDYTKIVTDFIRFLDNVINLEGKSKKDLTALLKEKFSTLDTKEQLASAKNYYVTMNKFDRPVFTAILKSMVSAHTLTRFNQSIETIDASQNEVPSNSSKIVPPPEVKTENTGVILGPVVNV